jgi:glycerophosphoryl diester phosphodiesterase
VIRIFVYEEIIHVKKLFRFISGFLAIVLIALVIPQNVYADTNDSSELMSDINKIESAKEENNTVVMLAHRGMSSLAPENTIPALEMAGLYGYGGVEFDICETKDGKFILSHDTNVSRMTNGSGMINKLTLAQIKKLKIDKGNGIENYSGLKVGTLEEALVCCNENNLMPYIEIKSIKNIKALLEILRKYNYLDKATIASQKVSIIKAIRKVNCNVKLDLISQKDGYATINLAKNLKCTGVSLKYNKLNCEVVSYAKQIGLTVTAWTVDTLTKTCQSRKYGVNFITTNCMADSNNLENLSVEKNYDTYNTSDDQNTNFEKMQLASSDESCIANADTWFEENNVTTVNIGNDMEYNHSIMEDDVSKGNIITITAQVNSIAGKHPYFKVYQDGSLNCNVEDEDNTTGWHKVKLVYTAKKAIHMKILFGMNENESGIFQIKDIQVSKLNRYLPDSITLTQPMLELSVGGIYNLQENILPIAKKAIIKWKSSKEKIASISELGYITAKKVGKTIVTVSTENGKTSECTVIVKPSKMSKLQVTNISSKKVKLSWLKDTSTKGYEIYYKEAGNEEYKLAKDIKKKSKTSVTIKNLKEGKKYYYKIRAYIKIDGKKYYGDFSKEIKIITKSH